MHKSKRTILIADDDSAIVDAISMILELENYTVVTETNGEVIKRIKESSPDLLLLDIWMGGVDGREICKQIKSDKQFAHIPVILISASRNIQDSTRRAGAEDYIEKPFDMDYLLNKIEQYLPQN